MSLSFLFVCPQDKVSNCLACVMFQDVAPRTCMVELCLNFDLLFSFFLTFCFSFPIFLFLFFNPVWCKSGILHVFIYPKEYPLFSLLIFVLCYTNTSQNLNIFLVMDKMTIWQSWRSSIKNEKKKMFIMQCISESHSHQVSVIACACWKDNFKVHIDSYDQELVCHLLQQGI